MMALDSAAVILMTEALVVLLLIVIAFLAISHSKRNKEIQQVDDFISQLDSSASLKNEPLNFLLAKTCSLEQSVVDQALKDITQTERALFQQVIKLFLQREISVLNDIEERIGGLSEPYCKLLREMAESDTQISTNNGPTVPAAGLESINQQLVNSTLSH